MRYTIKWRFLLKLTVVLLVAGAAVFFVHRWQVGRQVTAFLHQADRARDAAEYEQKAGNAEQALAERAREIEFVRRYAMARPDDIDARERLGRLMAETARTGKQAVAAYYFLEDTLRRDDRRDDLRRFTAELALILRLYKEAEGHLAILTKKILAEKGSSDGELEGLRGLCLEKMKKFPEAATAYKTAIDSRPDLLGSYVGLANLQRRELGLKTEADARIVEMVEKNRDKFRAHLFAAAYWREHDKPEQAAYAPKHVAEALRLAPEERDVLIEAAVLYRTQARKAAGERTPKGKEKADELIGEARRLLTQALEKDRKVPGVYLALAALEAESRQLPDAIEVIRKGLAEVPGSSELLLALLDYQYRHNDHAGMKETLAKLKEREKGVSQAVIDYHAAQALALEERWKEAAALLTRVVPALVENPLQARQANLLLAQCYEELGEHAKRLAPCTNALNSPAPLTSADPLWVPVMLALAETQSALGQVEDAIATYRRVAEVVPGVWVAVARLEMFRALAMPQQNWQPVEEALAKAEKAAKDKLLPGDLEIHLLRVAVLRQQGKMAEARKLVDALRAQLPKERLVWMELAFQDAKEKGPEQGLATLDAAEKEVGDSLEMRLARAALLVESKAADAPAKIEALAAKQPKLDTRQNRRLLRGLAEAASRAGANEASRASANEVAGRLWGALAIAKPFDLSVHLMRFDLAARAKNTAEMEKVLGSIREIDGENGLSARLAQAVLWVQQSIEKTDRAPRDKALALVEGLEREQGNSPLSARAVLTQALIHDLNANDTAARDKYRQARRLGALPPDSMRRLAELLLATGSRQDADEANELIEELKKAPQWGADLQRLAAVASLRSGDPAAALAHAQKAVKEDSKDFRDQIWLGRFYWFGKDPNDKARAEARFREAVRLAQDSAEAWLILTEYLVASERRPEAEKTFEEAKEKVKPAEKALFVALGHTRLGQTEKAIEAYKKASAENPNDVRTRMTEAEFLLQIVKLPEAREAFQRVAALPTATEADRRVARQRLALAMAADPDYAISEGAKELVGTPDPKDTPAQQRYRAVVLSLQRDRPSKLEAIRLLEANSQGRTPGEQFLLARLHLTVGNRDRFPVVMEDLLRIEQNRAPLYVGFYAIWLTRERRFADAQKWVAVLEKADPKSLHTAELKARLASARKEPASVIRAALSPHFDDPKVSPLLLSRICEEVGLHDEAEAFLKKHIEQLKGTKPEVVLSLAAYYGRRGVTPMTAKALQIWEESRGKFATPLVGSVAVDVLYHAAAPDPADVAKVADWLKDEAAKARGNDRAALLQQYASVLNLQVKFAESATIYANAIAENPRDALAMNNLAYLISAVHKKHDDALRLIEDAKRIIGRTNPDLLDTEALILIEKAEAGKAQKIMEVVVAENPTGVSYYHQALAEHRLGNKSEARRAWRSAQELGVKRADVHPLERDNFDEVSKAYQQ